MPIHEVHGFPVSTPNLNVTRSKVTLDGGATYIDLVDAIATAEESGTITLHTANTSNPHATTAAQVGAYTTAATDALIDAVEASIAALSVAATLVDDYGATGDGVADDTAEIIAAITAAGTYGKVVFTPGKTYLIDPTYAPTYQTYGGLKPLTGQTWIMDGATIQAKTVTENIYSVINLTSVDDVTLIGGDVYGERQTHVDAGGEFGHGIAMFAADRVTVIGTRVYDCWGDCVYVGPTSTAGTYCTDVQLIGMRMERGRRQGLSVPACRGLKVIGGRITDISGTAPQGGIDFEPDSSSYPNSDILIDGVTIDDTECALYVVVGNYDVRVRNCRLHGRVYSTIIGDNTSAVSFIGNTFVSDANAGTGGFSFIANTPSTINDVTIARNKFDGKISGGFFLLDSATTGATHVVVEDNDFEVAAANKRAVRLILGANCQFKRNRITYTGSGGINNDYFMLLTGTIEHGENRYYSSGSNAMYSALTSTIRHNPDHYISSNLHEASITGYTGIRVGGARAGTGDSGGGVADAATYAVTVTGFVGTNYNILMSVWGGGETTSNAYAVQRTSLTKTATGFTATLTNRGGATQTLYYEWVAIPA